MQRGSVVGATVESLKENSCFSLVYLEKQEFQKNEQVWLVYESLAFTSLDTLPIDESPLATYPRPGNVTELVIYRVMSP